VRKIEEKTKKYTKDWLYYLEYRFLQHHENNFTIFLHVEWLHIASISYERVL
jgi:hypothetical protein